MNGIWDSRHGEFIKGPVERGEFYFCDLTSGTGSQHSKRSPVLVIKNQVENQNGSGALIVPIVKDEGKSLMPTHVSLSMKNYPVLKHNSLLLFEQIRAIDRSRLLYKYKNTVLLANEMWQTKEALEVSLGLAQQFNSFGTLFKRGDIYLADLGIGYGFENKGINPVVIIQNNKGNQNSPTIIVAPIAYETTLVNSSYVGLSKRKGLKSDGRILIDQLTTIDKRNMFARCAQLTKKEIKELDYVIRNSFSLPD